MPRISSMKLRLISDTVKKLGYVDVRSVRRWFNFASLDDAVRALEYIAEKDERVELVYTLTFEKPGILTIYTTEEACESSVPELIKRMGQEGWILKSKQVKGAQAIKADDV